MVQSKNLSCSQEMAGYNSSQETAKVASSNHGFGRNAKAGFTLGTERCLPTLTTRTLKQSFRYPLYFERDESTSNLQEVGL